MERGHAELVIKAHTICAGKAEGEAVVYEGAFSFMGDLDPATGKVTVSGHPLEGKSLAHKIFIFTTGKGSGAGQNVAWRAKQKGTMPAAIICTESEPVLSGAVIATETPAVDRPEKNVFDLIKTGDYVKIDATAGIIERIEK